MPPWIRIRVESSPIEWPNGSKWLSPKLEFIAARHLQSADARFVELSGLDWDPRKGAFLAVSDRGYRLQLTPKFDPHGMLLGIEPEVLVASLPAPSFLGQFFSRAPDTEGVTIDPTHGRYWISIEGEHRIELYDQNWNRAGTLNPLDSRQAPKNDGLEAITNLRDGRILTITENFREAGGIVGYVGTENQWNRFIYPSFQNFQPTGLTCLNDGGVVLLERFYSKKKGNFVRLARLSAAHIEKNQFAKWEEVAIFGPPLPLDNFEGIASIPGNQNYEDIYLISDDNGNSSQKTLLYQFRYWY
ncbi:MAG: esterase-like activity of phytase family protein [Myxococcota bacterium]|nr:esterase-like activity of phytase family protein [Myxococcota bacterium]